MFKSSETLFNMLTYHYSSARFNILNFRRNNNKKFRSFKSKENIHKKEVGPYHGFGYYSLISDPINLAKGASGKYCGFANFNNGSRLKD